MCGRFFRHDVSWEDYRSALALLEPPAGDIDPPEPAYNIAPTQYAPILRWTPEGEGDRATLQLAPAMWGLVPSWWRKPLKEKKFSTFNARAEEAADKPVFRGAFRHRRCLVPASGFYEWSGEKGRKQAFAVSVRNRRWFCFAGLWDRAMIDGSELDSFTILTTSPNDLMAGLHTRMPVILDPVDYVRWLDPATPAAPFFEPYPTDAMQAWPVGPAVGNVRNQGPQLIEEA